MGVARLCAGALSYGLTNQNRELGTVKEIRDSFSPKHSSRARGISLLVNRKRLSSTNVVRSCSLSAKHRSLLLFSPMTSQRRHIFSRFNNQFSSHCGLHSSDVDTAEERALSTSTETDPELMGIIPSETSKKNGKQFAGTSTSQPCAQDAKHELIMLSLPAIAGQAIDPFAQLMETAYIGRLGPVELASAGVSISIFNIVSKLFNIPLLSVATSFVAEEISEIATGVSASEDHQEESTNGKPFHGIPKRQQLSSVSTALFLAVGIGILEALALFFGSGPFLRLMGISSASSMHAPAQRFLSLRAFGAPAVVVSLALQGVFRGFKDMKTPVLCLGIGNFAAIFLLPILIYYFRLGVTGAAISTVVSQYIVTFLMIWYLNKRAVLLPPNLGALKFGGYVKSGGFLIGRTLAVLATTTLATSMAARQGPLAMAAHQICLQVWLAVSLLTDALAASGQAMIASYLSKGDYRTVKEITYFVLNIGLVTGVFLAAILGVSFGSLATLFTNDTELLAIVTSGVLFVSASQPINALAFIFDGLHFGVSDFPYAARSMMLVGAISSVFLLYAPSVLGLPGVWLGLTLFMGLRMVAGYIRILSKTGPWWFLHADLNKTENFNTNSK